MGLSICSITLLQKTKSNSFDFIGKFENLEDDFQHVCNMLGIYNVKLPHLVGGKNKKVKEYRKHYDISTKRIVAKKYAEEIKYSKYKF